ncbi:MAG: CBS domain-containing protein [Methanomicrobiaceae archaeon]|nr:CBS domain-containing protein [Methanomicrobiaceae archaeon]
MKVKDAMTPNPVTVSMQATVSEAAGLLRKNRIGGLPVVEGERLVGIVTESDILTLLSTGEISNDLWLPSPLEIIEVPIREFINWEKTKEALSDIGSTQVQDVMTPEVIAVDADADIEEAASLMLREGIARLPVLAKGRLVGIVTRLDIVRGIGAGYEDPAERGDKE